jgi:hypothetical protein
MRAAPLGRRPANLFNQSGGRADERTSAERARMGDSLGGYQLDALLDAPGAASGRASERARPGRRTCSGPPAPLT